MTKKNIQYNIPAANLTIFMIKNNILKTALFALGIFTLLVGISACGGSGDEKSTAPEYKTYENLGYDFKIDYPPTYSFEEQDNKIVIYHFKEQPVPYFTIDIYDKTVDEVIGSLETAILADEETEKNDMEARQVTTFNEDLKANIDTYYFEHNNKTYSFSCLNGLYDDICSTFKFFN